MRDALAVVVPTRDRHDLLDRCVDALARSLRPGDELIVVDSASARPVGPLPALGVDARVLRCDQPGTSRARNAGWRAATRPLVAFVDDDIRVSPGWADAVAATAGDHPGVAFFTGRVTQPPDAPVVSRPVAVLDAPEPATIDGASNGSLGHGANLVVRRHALEAIDGFDEHLGPGTPLRAAEDYDLFDRLLASGALGRYEPEMLAYHEQWRDRRALLKLDWAYGIGGGARLAKLMRTDRMRARAAARVAFWTWGLKPAARDIRAGYEFGAAFALMRVAGTVVGLARGATVPVDGGHLRART